MAQDWKPRCDLLDRDIEQLQWVDQVQGGRIATAGTKEGR